MGNVFFKAESPCAFLVLTLILYELSRLQYAESLPLKLMRGILHA